jgi:hypothetical protein
MRSKADIGERNTFLLNRGRPMAMASQDHCLSAARWLAFTAPGVVHHPGPGNAHG